MSDGNDAPVLPADLKEVERICEAQWFDRAHFSLTAPDAARFVAWLPNIPLRQAGLDFIPRRGSIHSWEAMLEDFTAFLFPLIVGDRCNEVLYKALERFDFICQRIDDPPLGTDGWRAQLLALLLERGFAAGQHVFLRAVLPPNAQRVLDSLGDADPFAREEAAFTREASAMVAATFGKAGLVFTPEQKLVFPWQCFCGQLTAFVLPLMAAPAPQPALSEAMTQLFRLIKKSERGDVGRYRASTLCETLLNACGNAPYPFRMRSEQPEYYGGWRVDGYHTLCALLPELASLFSDEMAKCQDQSRIEEGGY